MAPRTSFARFSTAVAEALADVRYANERLAQLHRLPIKRRSR